MWSIADSKYHVTWPVIDRVDLREQRLHDKFSDLRLQWESRPCINYVMKQMIEKMRREVQSNEELTDDFGTIAQLLYVLEECISWRVRGQRRVFGELSRLYNSRIAEVLNRDVDVFTRRQSTRSRLIARLERLSSNVLFVLRCELVKSKRLKLFYFLGLSILLSCVCFLPLILGDNWEDISVYLTCTIPIMLFVSCFLYRDFSLAYQSLKSDMSEYIEFRDSRAQLDVLMVSRLLEKGI